MGIYRSLLRVYPRRFRDEYRDDMALLFAEQLRDGPASRVWARSLIDLTITIPARHLEAHMNRPPNPTRLPLNSTNPAWPPALPPDTSSLAPFSNFAVPVNLSAIARMVPPSEGPSPPPVASVRLPDLSVRDSAA